MKQGLKNAVMAIVIFAVLVSIITTQVTGTDAGSKLIQGLGYLLAGVAVVGALIAIAMNAFGGKRE